MRLKTKAFFSVVFLFYILVGCSPSKEEMLVGDWDAQWVTDPASYPGVDPATNFNMNGKFIISADGEITIEAHGYPNCIYGEDTLKHSQQWKLANDTLNLFNKPGQYGMTYKILEISEDKVKLQQLDDIFVYLTK